MDKLPTATAAKINTQSQLTAAKRQQQSKLNFQNEQRASLTSRRQDEPSDINAFRSRLSLGATNQTSSFLNQNNVVPTHSNSNQKMLTVGTTMKSHAQNFLKSGNSHLSSTSQYLPLSMQQSTVSELHAVSSRRADNAESTSRINSQPSSGLTSHKISVNQHKQSFHGQCQDDLIMSNTKIPKEKIASSLTNDLTQRFQNLNYNKGARRDPSEEKSLLNNLQNQLDQLLLANNNNCKDKQDVGMKGVKNVEIFLNGTQTQMQSSKFEDGHSRASSGQANLIQVNKIENQSVSTFDMQPHNSKSTIIKNNRLSVGGGNYEKNNIAFQGELDDVNNYKTMTNCFSTSQLIMNLTTQMKNDLTIEAGSVGGGNFNLQNQLKQKISEARNKINSKRQSSGLKFSQNQEQKDYVSPRDEAANLTSTSNLLASTQNLLSQRKYCQRTQVKSTLSPTDAHTQLQKSQSQMNGFDLFKRQIQKQRKESSPFSCLSNKDISCASQNDSRKSPLQRKLQFCNVKDGISQNKVSFQGYQQQENLSGYSRVLKNPIVNNHIRHESNKSTQQNLQNIQNHFQIATDQGSNSAKIIVSQKGPQIDTQDTSLDSLMQICNILPDSRGIHHHKNDLKDKLGATQANYFSQNHSHSNSNSNSMSNFTSNYGTVQQSNIVSFNDRKDQLLKEKSKLQKQKSGDTSLMAAQEYYDQRKVDLGRKMSTQGMHRTESQPQVSYLKKDIKRGDENAIPNKISRVLSNERDVIGHTKKFEAKSSFENRAETLFKDPFLIRDNKRSSFFKSIENFQMKQGEVDNSYTYLSPQQEEKPIASIVKPKYTLVGQDQIFENIENLNQSNQLSSIQNLQTNYIQLYSDQDSHLNYQITEKIQDHKSKIQINGDELRCHMDEFLRQSQPSKDLLMSQKSFAFKQSFANSSSDQVSCQAIISPQVPQSNTAPYAYEMFASFASPLQNQGDALTMSDVQPLGEGDSSIKQSRYQHAINQTRKLSSALKDCANDTQPSWNNQSLAKQHNESTSNNFRQIISPTPKFSLHLDKDGLILENQKQIGAESARVKRISLLSEQLCFATSNVQKSKSSFFKENLDTITNQDFHQEEVQNVIVEQLDSAETMKRKDDIFFTKTSLVSVIQDYQNQNQLDFGGIPSSKTFDIPNKDYFECQNASISKPFVKHQKSNSRPSMHFMSKLQYKGPLFQTQHDGRIPQEYFNSEIERQNMLLEPTQHLSKPQTLNIPCISPLSDRHETTSRGTYRTNDQVDKLGVLQRTASLDHYLSNCTTFLRGQRFLSPTNRQERLNLMSTLKTREQIKAYFMRLLLKKLAKIRKINMRTSLAQMRRANQNLRQAKAEKVGILNLVREYVMKNDALCRWKQIRKKEVFKRKGFAVLKLAEALKVAAFLDPFSRIKQTDNYRSILNPDRSEQVELLIRKWSQKHAWQTWFSFHKYRKFLKKRSILFQRVMVNVMEKNQLKESLILLRKYSEIQMCENEIVEQNQHVRGESKLEFGGSFKGERVNRERSFNCLNSKIIEILNKMSEDSQAIILTDYRGVDTFNQTPGSRAFQSHLHSSILRQIPEANIHQLNQAHFSDTSTHQFDSPHTPSLPLPLHTPPLNQTANFYDHTNQALKCATPHLTSHNSSVSGQSSSLSDLIQPSKIKIIKTLAAHQLFEKLAAIKKSKINAIFTIYKDYKIEQQRLNELSLLQDQIKCQSEMINIQLGQQRQKLISSGLRHLEKQFKRNSKEEMRKAFLILKQRSDRKIGSVRMLVR